MRKKIEPHPLLTAMPKDLSLDTIELKLSFHETCQRMASQGVQLAKSVLFDEALRWPGLSETESIANWKTVLPFWRQAESEAGQKALIQSVRKRPLRFDGDIIVTDPCYVMIRDDFNDRDDWERCDYGDNMAVLGLGHSLISNTVYGDWSCTTFENNTRRVLGHFCADAGMVGVFLLSDILAYNPDFNDHTNKDWCATWLRDFHGTIRIGYSKDYGVRVHGRGNINFYTVQTGF